MKKYALSPSTLNIFIDCPRCFWLHINRNIKRPRGIFPSLPGGMDLVIKTYFDAYRLKSELPPELIGKAKGKLFQDAKMLGKWRSWKDTNLFYEDDKLNASLSGALDDCLVEEGFYIPLDYKTRGSEPIDDPRKFYQIQLDCYCLILEATGFKTKGLAYLLYYWPTEVSEDGLVKFKVKPISVETDIESAKRIFREALICLNGKMPLANLNCEYCNFVISREEEQIKN